MGFIPFLRSSGREVVKRWISTLRPRNVLARLVCPVERDTTEKSQAESRPRHGLVRMWSSALSSGDRRPCPRGRRRRGRARSAGCPRRRGPRNPGDRTPRRAGRVFRPAARVSGWPRPAWPGSRRHPSYGPATSGAHPDAVHSGKGAREHQSRRTDPCGARGARGTLRSLPSRSDRSSRCSPARPAQSIARAGARWAHDRQGSQTSTSSAVRTWTPYGENISPTPIGETGIGRGKKNLWSENGLRNATPSPPSVRASRTPWDAVLRSTKAKAHPFRARSCFAKTAAQVPPAARTAASA